MPEKFAPEVNGNWAVFNFKVVSKSADLMLRFQFAIDKQPQYPTAVEAKTSPLHFNVASVVLRAPISIKVHRVCV